MNNYNLDFLYYQTPPEYIGLDVEQDPELDKIEALEEKFQNYMSHCSIQDYVTVIIEAFCDKMPNSLSLESTLAEFELGEEDIIYVDSYRKNKDITKVDSRLQEVITKEGWEIENLDEFEIEFRDNQPQLQTWITDTLGDKTFTVNNAAGVSTIEVEESPILRIRLEDKNLIIKANTDYAVWYI